MKRPQISHLRLEEVAVPRVIVPPRAEIILNADSADLSDLPLLRAGPMIPIGARKVLAVGADQVLVELHFGPSSVGSCVWYLSSKRIPFRTNTINFSEKPIPSEKALLSTSTITFTGMLTDFVTRNSLCRIETHYVITT